MELEGQTDGQAIENALPPAVEGAPSEPAAEPATNGKPPGYDPIDFATASPEEIKTRYDYLYKQIKDQKRTEKTLSEYRRLVEDQGKRIDELTNGFTGVVDHLQEQTFSTQENLLLQQRQKAYEAGDNAAYFAAQDKLDELRIEKKLGAKTKQAPQQQTQKPQQAESPDGIQIPDDDMAVINIWQDETGADGSPLRAWARPRFEGDPVHLAALNETFAVFRNPRFANLSVAQRLAEVDRRMGVMKQQAQQAVLGGNLTRGGKSAKITLSPKQIEIATRTKFGGPQAKSDADHIEAYRKQIEQSRQKGQR